MLKKIWFWLNASRLFSLPMTILTWLVIFIYSLKFHGDILNGILALFGIALAHLATNLADDYFDYKQMLKDSNMMSTVVKNKCAYIKDGQATLNDIFKVVAIYCLIAFIIGVILTFRSGLDVIWLAAIGGILTLSYSWLSRIGLSEFAVGIAFGPLFFEGVYYVMTKSFSFDVLLLSIAVGAFTVGVLYAHTLLDFDSDMISHKKTLCCRIGNKSKALVLLALIYLFGFKAAIGFAIFSQNQFVLITLLTFPFALNVIRLERAYAKDKNFTPKVHFWNYPLDNWKKCITDGTTSFYFVLYQSRNLVNLFCVLMILAIIFGTK